MDVILGEFRGLVFFYSRIGVRFLRLDFVVICAAAGEADQRGGGLLRRQEAWKCQAEGQRWQQSRALKGDARPYAAVWRDYGRGDLP
jgi:hypothetical protein